MSATARQRLQFLPPPNQITGDGSAAAFAVPPPVNHVPHATPEVQQ